MRSCCHGFNLPERGYGGVYGVFVVSQTVKVDLLLHPGENLTLSLVNLLTHTLLSTQRELKQANVNPSFCR